MRPSKALIYLVLGWLAAALVLFAIRVSLGGDAFRAFDAGQSGEGFTLLASLWQWSLCVLGLVALYDWLKKPKFENLVVERTLPHSLALGVPAKISTTVENNLAYEARISLTEYLPANIRCAELPIEFTVAPGKSRTFEYWVTPIGRGEALFRHTGIRLESKCRLWQRLHKVQNPESIKIYPNFAPIAKSASIGLEHQLSQLGVHLQQRRGEGSDFHQLREFRDGDAFRQIDWKATAKNRRPISREYQDERDQDIFFLLDCGRRLRNKDDDISHFDHALNALLITSYIALRQGDGVGLMSFAGAPRWLPPVKGPSQINQILNKLYDLYSSTQSSDYISAAEEFLARHNKRSLVIIVTNAYDEDADDLCAATALLRKRHIVMVASLRDLFWDQLLDSPVEDFSSALKFCGTSLHLSKRRQLLAKLQHMGVIMTDSRPNHLHVDLVNEYMRLKRSGRL